MLTANSVILPCYLYSVAFSRASTVAAFMISTDSVGLAAVIVPNEVSEALFFSVLISVDICREGFQSFLELC